MKFKALRGFDIGFNSHLWWIEHYDGKIEIADPEDFSANVKSITTDRYFRHAKTATRHLKKLPTGETFYIIYWFRGSDNKKYSIEDYLIRTKNGFKSITQRQYWESK